MHANRKRTRISLSFFFSPSLPKALAYARRTLHADRRVKGSFALVSLALHAAKIEILITGERNTARPPTGTALLLVIEFIKIKIKHRARGRITSGRGGGGGEKKTPRDADAGGGGSFAGRQRAISSRFRAQGFPGKISSPKYLSREKVASFQLSASTLFAGSLCIDRRGAARLLAVTDRYKLFNLRINSEILPGTQTRRKRVRRERERGGEKRGVSSSYLVKGSLPRVRRTNISRRRTLPLPLLSPATCPGVKKAEEKTEEAARRIKK